MAGDLVKARAEVTGSGASGELVLGEALPGVLARLFPGRAARSRATTTVAAIVLEKLRRGEPLSQADLKYAEARFGEDEAKWIRRNQIAARALAALKARTQTNSAQLAPAGAGEESKGTEEKTETSADWVLKFWADAELVSDQTVQEIYARILASEALRPGMCSLRTLRVLRYLDRETAEAFGKLTHAVFGTWVPRHRELKEIFGIHHDMLLDLDDAGLIESDANLSKVMPRNRSLIAYGALALRLENCKGLRYPTFPLTRAGIELVRVAQIERDPDKLFLIARWLQAKKPDCRATWADLPYPDWRGPSDKLSWRPIPDERLGGDSLESSAKRVDAVPSKP
jgi:Protein of unknown function (DUF2806)